MRLGEIDRNKKPVKPNLFLCLPDKRAIKKITEAYDIEYLTQLGTVNELSFKIPTIIEKDRVPIDNPNIQNIRHRYLFKLVFGSSVEYFVFNERDKSFSESDEHVSYKAYSLGYELMDKNIRDVEFTSKNLTEMLTETLRYTNWRVGYVDSEFDMKYRSHEISTQAVLQTVYDLAHKFNAVIRWDTLERKINFFMPDNVGRDKGFRIRYGKYLESFNLATNSEETITRLKVYGQDELSIRRLTPTGANYLEDFSWYMYPFKRDSSGNVVESSYYMSDNLCIAIEEYTDLIANETGNFNTLTTLITEKQGEILEQEINLSTLENELVQIKDAIDLSNAEYNSETSKHASLILDRENKENEIVDQINAINILEGALNTLQNQLSNLRTLVDVENNFTAEQLMEMNQFIIEKEYVNNTIVDDEDLLKDGIEAFRKFREPKIDLNIGVVNFLEIVECQNDWDKLVLGDVIRVQHERFGEDIKAKIIEINYLFEEGTINLTIANEREMNQIDDFMQKIYDAGNTSTIVDMDKYKWDLSLENNGTINAIINNKWDALKNAIMAGYNQEIEISERGIIVRSLEDPESWLVIQNGFLAITNDNGNTWKHSITKDGIVGERIYGKIIMGVNLAIEDESGILKFRGSRGQVFDRNGNEVMRLGLVSDDNSSTECFGIKSWNSMTRVALTDCEGISISRIKDTGDWDKIFWVSADDGTLYTKDMVAERLKIVNNIGDVILDAENGFFDIGWFDKILADGKLTTSEKYEIWTRVNTIMSEYQLLLSHAEKFKFSDRDSTYNINAQNVEATKNPSNNTRVSTNILTQMYNALISYIGNYISIPPQLDNAIMERVDEVDRHVFVTRFKNYYDEAQKVREAIEDYMIYSGLQIGRFYNNLILDAQAGFMAVRNDLRYRARLSATEGLALEKWEGGGWVKKLYASLGDPNYEDGTLIAENLVAKSLRIVDGNLGDRIILDSLTGITIFGDRATIYLNANEGIRINAEGRDKFYVGTDGRLYAVDITTHNLKIVDGSLGEKIIFDQDEGITINGNNGEQIRLNANEGIAVDVNGDRRIWIGNDGLLYAKRLIVVDDEDEEEVIFDEVTGSFISDLTVNKVRTLNSKSPQDHVFIMDNFIKLLTGDAQGSDYEKFKLSLEDTAGGNNTYPMAVWGMGNPLGTNRAYMSKPSQGFYIDYVGDDGHSRLFALQNSQQDSILLETSHRVKIKGEKAIRLEANSSNYIEITPTGVKIVGSRIDLN